MWVFFPWSGIYQANWTGYRTDQLCELQIQSGGFLALDVRVWIHHARQEAGSNPVLRDDHLPFWVLRLGVCFCLHRCNVCGADSISMVLVQGIKRAQPQGLAISRYALEYKGCSISSRTWMGWFGFGMSLHLTHLLSHFCQKPACRSRIRQTLELHRSKSAQPRSANWWNTLYLCCENTESRGLQTSPSLLS